MLLRTLQRAQDMRVNINDLPDRYKAQASAQLAARPARPASQCKPDTVDELAGAQEAERSHRPAYFQRPVRISYTEYRLRLLDADNAWSKYATDGLITAGLLQDDSPAEIPERPTHKQMVVERGENDC